MTVEENVSLGPLTTFHIGGPARFFARVQQVAELQESLDFARDKALNVFVLGGGSNVLVDDAGFDGLVIKVEITGVEEKGTTFIAGAGESWDALVLRAVQKNLWGIENLSGIPGTVGGAVVQNIGAYGQALSQALLWVEVYEVGSGQVVQIQNANCGFDYRTSKFKKSPGQYVIVRAAFKLSSTSNPNLEYRDPTLLYKDIARILEKHTNPLPIDIRTAVLEIRASKFPDIAKEGTAGSFFLNPVLSKEHAETLKKRYPELPLFMMPETSNLKVPLAWLLDYRHGVLDMRKVHIGGARMYEKQFLVIAAKRGTSSADVKKLSRLVQEKVRTTIGVEIAPEVTVI